MKIKYKNPPINELVIGLYFDREVTSFRLEHVGLFWSTLRQDFPTVHQQPIVVPPLGASALQVIELLANEFSPMPRFWLESADGSTLMQIQRNAFLFNWRKRAGVYPHYDYVKSAFDKNFSHFTRFLETEVGAPHPNLQIAELTYINLIESGEYWQGSQDTARVFPRFQLPTCGSSDQPTPEFNQVTTQQFAQDLTLITSIRSGRSAQRPNEPVLIFELRALGLLGAADKEDADAWFCRAHETIGDCFTGMTSPDIQQRYWQPV